MRPHVQTFAKRLYYVKEAIIKKLGIFRDTMFKYDEETKRYIAHSKTLKPLIVKDKMSAAIPKPRYPASINGF